MSKRDTKSSKQQIGVADVANPFFNAAHPASSGNPRRIKAAYNLLESPIVYMIAKGQVTQAQGEAGLHFRRIFEAAGGVGAKALDYSREPVDGGAPIDPVNARQWRAAQKLREAHALLGGPAYDIVREVCGQGVFIRQLHATKHAQTMAGKRLQTALSVLAYHWGYETKATRRWRK